MELFANKSNNSRDININTRGKQFRQVAGDVQSALGLGFWNEMISLKIYPAIPENERTNEDMFDYTQSISTSLTVEKAYAIVKAIKRMLVNNGDVPNMGIVVGENNMIEIGCANSKINSPYIAIHKNIDNETKKAETSAYYQFNQMINLVWDYNPETGDYDANQNCGESEILNCELQLFGEMLLHGIRELSMAGVHAQRYNERFSGGNNKSSNRLTFGGSNNNQSRNTEQAETDHVSSLADFLD